MDIFFEMVLAVLQSMNIVLKTLTLSRKLNIYSEKIQL